MKTMRMTDNRDNIAPLDWGLLYIARFVGETDDMRNYRIEERKAGLLTRTFTGVVNGTQRASAKPTDVDKVERWCKLRRSELPKDGETVAMNVDEVHRD
jgi:hypothetical protein